MLFTFVEFLRIWWSTLALLVTVGWEDKEFVALLAQSSAQGFWAGIAVSAVFIGLLTALEFGAIKGWSGLITRMVLLASLVGTVCFHSVNASRSLLNEAIEVQRLTAVADQLLEEERSELRQLLELYSLQLKTPSPRKRAAAEQRYRQVLGYRQATEAFPSTSTDWIGWIAARSQRLQLLTHENAMEMRQVPLRPILDVSSQTHGTVEIMKWVRDNWQQKDAFALICDVVFRLLLILLVVLVGLHHHETQDARQGWMDAAKISATNPSPTRAAAPEPEGSAVGGPGEAGVVDPLQPVPDDEAGG